MPLQSLGPAHDVPNIFTFICLAVNSDFKNDGARLAPYQECGLESVPHEYRFVDVWYSFRLSIPGFSEHYPMQRVTVHAKPVQNSSSLAAVEGRSTLDEIRSRFTPVLVIVNEKAAGIHRELY